MKMSKSVKGVVIGITAVAAGRRLVSWGIGSAALGLSTIQRALDDAATPLPRPDDLPPRLRRDREAVDGLQVVLDVREQAPVG